MHMQLSTAVLFVLLLAQTVAAQLAKEPSTSATAEGKEKQRGGACDFDRFTQAVLDVQKRRKERLLTAEEFAKLAAMPGTIVLDARSEGSFELLHVKGSINLPYTNFGMETLQKIIPNHASQILIYCRNNIKDETFERVEWASASNRIVPKMRASGLNLPVAVTLFIYGYENVNELDEIVAPDNCAIKFEWTQKYRDVADSIGLAAKKE